MQIVFANFLAILFVSDATRVSRARISLAALCIVIDNEISRISEDVNP
jgi:hypothetical protein